MKRFSMSEGVILSLFLFAALGGRMAAQEGSGEPIFRKVPIIAELFNVRQEAALEWASKAAGPSTRIVLETAVPLSDSTSALAEHPGFLERWLMKNLPKRCRGVESVDLVDDVVIRRSGEAVSVVRSRALDVKGPREAGESARAIVESMRGAKKGMAEVSLYFVVLNDDDLKSQTDTVVSVGSPDDIEKVLRELEERKATTLTAPKITAYLGQHGEIRISNQTAYIKDYEVRSAADTVIADPIIDVVEDGLKVDVTVIRLPGQEGLCVDAAITMSALKKPMETFETSIIEGAPKVKLQLPEVSFKTWKSDEIVIDPKSGGFVVRAFQYVDDKKARKEAVIVCKIDTKEAPDADDIRIVAVDRDASIAIAKAPSGTAMTVGQLVKIGDGDSISARGHVVAIDGKMIEIKITEGTPKRNERVR